MPKRDLFITFEGTDGVGKSTQARLLKKELQKKGYPVLLTREPGGGAISEKIRKILLDPNSKIEDLTELFLYEAARVEHVQKIIRPALKRKKIVLCDRFTDATMAYQGYARHLSKKTIQRLNSIAADSVVPKITILLDLPPQKSLKKAKNRKKEDRLENEGICFQKKVRKGYLALAKEYPKRIKIIQVQSSIRETQQQIQNVVFNYLNK